MQSQYCGQILAVIESKGFEIIAAKVIHLTKNQAEGFYAEHKERPFFSDLCQYMTSGKVLVFALKKENAVQDFRKLIGATNPAKAAPDTIRKRFAQSMEANAIHGSDSDASAEREIHFFFPSSEILD